jgi:hypothetical protein
VVRKLEVVAVYELVKWVFSDFELKLDGPFE